jgi:hypothetical protein
LVRPENGTISWGVASAQLVLHQENLARKTSIPRREEKTGLIHAR